jgi:4-hydroxymandelate oxidase
MERIEEKRQSASNSSAATMMINIADYEAKARSKMLPAAYDYFAGGALDERTIANNQAAFGDIHLVPRVLRGASTPKISTRLAGHSLAAPIIISPTAFHGLAHPDGEVATATAANALGTIMTVSTTASSAIADVTSATSYPVWFQLYMLKDRAITRDLVREAEVAGCKAIVLTVDVPAWGRRERDMRNEFALPKGAVIKSLLLKGREDFYDGTMNVPLSQFISERFKFDLTWEDVVWLRGVTKLPVFVKGVVHPLDAVEAVKSGAAGVIISNHGGRQLDTCIPTLFALPSIVQAIGDRVPIVLDGGIRRGVDVLKAIALGATAVAVGRPVIWGIAADGARGATRVLEIIRDEFRNAMSLCGCNSITEITSDLLRWNTTKRVLLPRA